MKITVNQVLVVQKALRDRVSELRRLRSEVSTKESFLYGREEKKLVEPQYDVKLVDKKITELEMFLFKSEAAVKMSNAKTEVELDFDMDNLLGAIQ